MSQQVYALRLKHRSKWNELKDAIRRLDCVGNTYTYSLITISAR